MIICCVGGGPGGLFFAIAAARRDRRHSITVLERRPVGADLGWGIAVATSRDHHRDLLYEVAAVDQETASEIADACTRWTGQRLSVGAVGPVHLGGAGQCIGRRQLVDILVRRARSLGVEVRHDCEVTSLEEVARADLVVVADGAASRLRRSAAQDFGTFETSGQNVHAWLGTRVLLDDFTYAFEETASGWVWFHGYRHAPAASTVVVECARDTARELFTRSPEPGVDTAALSRVFARQLGDHPLEDRQASRWETFRTVRNQRWHADNVVLLGDAAHTAHFSIGSGTTMAFADAAVLGRLVAGANRGELPGLLQQYEALRRPAALDLQEAADLSARWFEHVEDHLRLDPVRLGLALQRRNVDTGRASPWLTAAHRATQWRVGRACRRAVAGALRAATLPGPRPPPFSG